MLLIRFELDAALGVLMATDEDRNLSCTLNVSWPSGWEPLPAALDADRLRREVADAFRVASRASRPLSHWSQVEEGRFTGWLTFASAVKADEAFRRLRAELNRHQLGVVQTIRDVSIPRDWRAH